MHPSSTPSVLADVARRLEAAVHGLGWGGPPLLVGLAGDDPPGALPPVEAATDDPVADLLGYRVPQDCSGLAVVGEGSGRRLVDDDVPPSVDEVAGVPVRGEPRRCRLAYVLDRSGRAGAAVRQEGGAVRVEGYRSSSVDGPTGRLVDVCHRALDLPTRPAPPDTAELWLLSWLDLLMARALGVEPPRTWAEAARVHPVLQLLEAAGRPPADPVRIGVAELGRMGLALGGARSWSDLRSATSRGEWSAQGLTSEHAAWMDDGMFARWVTGEFLAVPLYLEELDQALPAPIARKVEMVAASVTGRQPTGSTAGDRPGRGAAFALPFGPGSPGCHSPEVGSGDRWPPWGHDGRGA